jgi:hypothetical protein
LSKRSDSAKITERPRVPAPARAKHLENAVPQRSKHQQKVIKNYYENREAISLQRLSELVTELYLAEGKNRARQWTFIRTALEKLKIPPKRIEDLVKQDNPALVAKLVEELLAKG